MRVQVAIPENRIEQPVLDAALEAVTRLNESLIENGEAPLFRDALQRVRWKPEPPGQEHFDHAKAVMERGHGDCDDLAPWHAASLRVTGQDPGAMATVYQSGPNRWHAVVQRSDGRFEDPSAAAGMHQYKGQGASRADPLHQSVVGGAYMIRPQIALTPRWGQWTGRVDIPWHWAEEIEHGEPNATDWAMTTLHTSPTASAALTGAIMGAVDLAEQADGGDDDHLERLCCLAGASDGIDFDDLADEYGVEHAQAAYAVVGAVFGQLRQAYGLHPYDDSIDGYSFGDFMDDAMPIAKEVIPEAAGYIPVVGPAARPLARYGLELIDREREKRKREGKPPIRLVKVPKGKKVKRASPQDVPRAAKKHRAAQAGPHKPQRAEVVHTREHGRWICRPA